MILISISCLFRAALPFQGYVTEFLLKWAGNFFSLFFYIIFPRCCTRLLSSFSVMRIIGVDTKLFVIDPNQTFQKITRFWTDPCIKNCKSFFEKGCTMILKLFFKWCTWNIGHQKQFGLMAKINMPTIYIIIMSKRSFQE